MLVQAALSALSLWYVVVVASSNVNQTTDQEVSSLLSVMSSDETRRVRRLEAEMETLRRMVTELKAAGPCTTQPRYTSQIAMCGSCIPFSSSVEADALSVAQEVRGLRHHVQSLRMHAELSAIRSELQSLRSRVPSDVNVTEKVKPPVLDERSEVPLPSKSAGSVYTRWGNGQCPSEAQLVYSGVIGGSHYTHEGAAANALCLPLDPVFLDHNIPSGYTFIYGTEYEVSTHPSNELEAKCAVCHVARGATILVPATNSCHTGWTLEYSGILMAGHHGHKSATEFVCMDSALEGMIGTKDDKGGKLFYYVMSQCGSLPCPPYINAKILNCVVCSY